MKKLLWYLSAVGVAVVSVPVIYAFFYITALWFGYQGSILDMFSHTLFQDDREIGFFFAKVLSWAGGVVIGLFYTLWLFYSKKKKESDHE